jgi:hypothetical protein
MAGNEGVVFLGWRIQRHHERGAGKSYVYIYPATKALVAVMARVKTLCRQSTNLPLNVLLHRLKPDAAGLDHVLQLRLLTRDLQLLEVLPVEAGRQVARAQASAHGLETARCAVRCTPGPGGDAGNR